MHAGGVGPGAVGRHGRWRGGAHLALPGRGARRGMSGMEEGVRLRCRCGGVAGTVDAAGARAGSRVVCYCDDCQAFARRLSAAELVLDEHGGTDLVQTSPAGVVFTRGAEQLACLRLTPKGPLRWYAACCGTPIGNTGPTREIPFVGLVRACLDTGGRSPDEALGRVRARIMARHATGGRPAGENVHDGFPASHILPMLWKILGWRLRGDHRRTPFFDAASGRPVATPALPPRTPSP